jgi:hypothetical protein
MNDAIVYMEGTEKSFPGVHDLDNCRFELLPGAGHAPVRRFVDTGFHWYGKTNIDDSPIKSLLYN